MTAAGAEVVFPPLPTPTLLETDGSAALHSVRLPLALPFGVGLIRVEFDLDYGTREQPEPDTFLDSISLWFEPPAVHNTALLFNADARNEAWLPENPGGVPLPDGFLGRSPIPPPGEGPGSWPVLASFAVTLTLPIAWQNCESALWLDLFDNRAGHDSFAQLRNLRLVARNPFFLLESSASPAGPFSVEMGVHHAPDRQQFELRRGGEARFFRLRADSAVRLRVLAREPDAWRFAYDFPDPNPRLESANHPLGPYLPETTAVLDPDRRQFRLPSTATSARFFRIRADVRTVITRFESEEGAHRIDFEYRPRIFSLQSSAQPCGPYADDPVAVFDTAQQVVSVSRTNFIRFFRITHSTPTDVVQVRWAHGDSTRWVLAYDVRPEPTDSSSASAPPSFDVVPPPQ
ncbi:MAG: hypothetical protein AB7O66_00255 [Limisphaerales bacterium]